MIKQKEKIGSRLSIISVLINLSLFGLKYWAGIVSGSVSIIVDAWHTLSDSFTSIIVLFGLKYSNKPPDEKHPFGHGRSEMIFTVIVGTILAIVGFEFLIKSINYLMEKNNAIFGTLPIIIISISIVVKEVMAQITIHYGKKADSKLLIADGKHHRSDAFTSILILIGILLGKKFWWIDSALGIALSLIIFHSAYEILTDSISRLIGETPKKHLIGKIKKIVEENFEIFNLHHFHLHCYGDHKEITFHIKLKPDMKIIEAHKIATKIELLIRKKLDLEATIHVEPLTNERSK